AAIWRSREPSSTLVEDEPFVCEQMPLGIALVATTRAAAADLPTWSVVAARRTSHVHAVAFEVQHRVVASKPADRLTEPPEGPRHRTAVRVVCDRPSGCRELLGVVGHHRRYPCPFSYDPFRYDAVKCSLVSGFPDLRNIKRYATARERSGSGDR